MAEKGNKSINEKIKKFGDHLQRNTLKSGCSTPKGNEGT